MQAAWSEPENLEIVDATDTDNLYAEAVFAVQIEVDHKPKSEHIAVIFAAFSFRSVTRILLKQLFILFSFIQSNRLFLFCFPFKLFSSFLFAC